MQKLFILMVFSFSHASFANENELPRAIEILNQYLPDGVYQGKNSKGEGCKVDVVTDIRGEKYSLNVTLFQASSRYKDLPYSAMVFSASYPHPIYSVAGAPLRVSSMSRGRHKFQIGTISPLMRIGRKEVLTIKPNLKKMLVKLQWEMKSCFIAECSKQKANCTVDLSK